LGDKQLELGSAAPLLGIVSLFGIHIMITILFIDAVIAPLGTANVYTAATSRILYGLSKDFFPKSFLTRVNKFASPVYCLWINAIVGVCFLAPFPTWTQLVDFLSSVVVFSYLAGPVALVILRKDFPEMNRTFKVLNHKLVAYAGFACCGLMIYWSSLNNLIYLSALAFALIVIYNLFIDKNKSSLSMALKENFFVVAYLLAMLVVKYLHKIEVVSFPLDNVLIIVISCIACKIFIGKKINKEEIARNIERIKAENTDQHSVH
jgi:amino acid transporter